MKFATSVAATGSITAIPFCPIENGNIIKLTVQVNGFSTPRNGKAFSMMSDTSPSGLGGVELDIVVGKEDTMLAKQGKSYTSDEAYQWMVIMGDSTAVIEA